MFLPQPPTLCAGNQRQVDHERREVIQILIEVIGMSAWVLIVLVTDLARGPAGHLRHKDSIVIDESQMSVFDDDVAVLKIAMCHPRRSQRSQQAQPFFRKMQEHILSVEHLADVEIQGWAFDPLHEENRKSLAADEDSFGSVSELRKVRHWRGPAMFLNRALSLIAISEIATKAAHGKVTTDTGAR